MTMVNETKKSQDIATESSPTYLKAAALRAYSERKKQAVDQEQIVELLPMVPAIVRRVVTYLKPPLSFEDLVSAGTVGLVKAAKDFDASQDAEFKTYAYIRIRGAVLDELRKWSFVSTNLCKQINKAMNMIQAITSETGHSPTDNELAKRLNISVETLYEIYQSARSQHFVSMDGSGQDAPSLINLLPASDASRPDNRIEKQELIENLAQAIEQLPKRKRQLILLYYQQNLTMKQVAEVFQITEPRVSQLHASALFFLLSKLKKWKNNG